MLYLTFKTAHIVAVVFWIGSLFLLTLLSSTHGVSSLPMKTLRRVTEAGIGLTWLAGIILVVLGSWYSASWWQIKIVLVVGVSAIHTMVHRRWQLQTESGARTNPALPWAVLILTGLIVALAVFKQP